MLEKRPDYIHACNCTLCSKSGAHWGYFIPAEVSVEGQTGSYVRADKPNAGAEIHFCSKCGSTTHFVLTDEAIAQVGNVVMGVNMRLADEADLAGIELRFPDGRAWSGEGAFGYVREPLVYGEPSGT
ncbi:aldehyde-activating protein [Tepidamorphus sp. 3E244]|uniref:aldehyde-activating protein n=1 Tax=Tepidamorphus sp. 3E244 TaxID=3385498 RepID=UPI0038FCDEF8